ncbi:MAG: hypothetical protein O7F16_04220 [Acidobacteria bacterium]|nr:hypothetical protein [Acidobacteriota bacterium]
MSPDPEPHPLRRDDLRMLGLRPTASTGDILPAYMKLRRALRRDSPAMRSAASEEERCVMLERIEQAYRRLCSQVGLPLRTGGALTVGQAHPDRFRLRQRAPGSAVAAGSQPSDPPLDMRSRPSPFRGRPSRPLS